LTGSNKSIEPESNVTPIAILLAQTGNKKEPQAPLIALLDSGTTSCIAIGNRIPFVRATKSRSTDWSTKAGNFKTSGKGTLTFIMPEFATKPKFEFEVHLDQRDDTSMAKYDVILGTNFMRAFGINLKFDDRVIEHEGATIPMRNRDSLNANVPHLVANAMEETYETEATKEMVSRMTRIAESKYEPADLNKVVRSCTNLSNADQSALYEVLKGFESMFDGKLGEWRMEPISIKLKKDARPVHARAYTIPKIYETTVKNEIEQFVERGILRKVNRSEWASPTFIVPKKLNVGQDIPAARVVVDFRRVNEMIVRYPYPVPKIQHLLMTLEGFQYATSLDLIQGYHQMPLDDNAKKICTIVLPWGKYEYTRLPMGIKLAGDAFQQRMNDLLGHLPYVRCYLDDILIVTKGDWKDHLKAITTVLEVMEGAGLKVNAEKSFFGRKELDYLGYHISQDGIRPDVKKVEAIKAIAPPKTRRQLRSFIGMINFYRDVWKKRSHLLAPMTKLMSTKIPFKWTDEEQKAFDEIKNHISAESLLTYPNFDIPFDVYTDASDRQLGAVILQEGKPIAHFSRTLNPAQRNYTVTDKETLSIVELLKEYRNILYGHKIRVYTDHKNITQPNIASQRIMRWRTIMEEFAIELIYVKGSHNEAADALSRLPRITAAEETTEESAAFELEESFNIDALPIDAFPIRYDIIHKTQQQDKRLADRVNKPDDLITRPFVGGGTVSNLICDQEGKIIIPEKLQERVLVWYHSRLVHLGRDRLYESIHQHFDWPNKGELRRAVRAFVRSCDVCQTTKRAPKKYGHLPEKKMETTPWETIHIDLYGPKKIKRKEGPPIEFKVVTMIDPVTGWFEMCSFDDKQPETILNILEYQWLARYPRPSKIIADRGGEFIGHVFRQTLNDDYGIDLKLITTANPQANAVVERIHQVIGNMLRTMSLEDMYLLPPPYDPFAGVIAAIGYALRSSWHTTMQATPGQLVFGRDMALNIKHIADWNYMQQRRQRTAAINNRKENSRRIPHQYKIGDEVLKIKANHTGGRMTATLESAVEGPYKITKVRDNGTVTIRRTVRGGARFETLNIRRVRPFIRPGQEE
jgi:hypothetical protein